MGPAHTAAARRPAARRAEPRVVPQFTPDGAYLFAITNAGRAYRWDVRPSSWADTRAPSPAAPLTRAEWKDALPGRDYEPTC